MRRTPVAPGPSPAERCRTTLAFAPTLTLEVAGCVEELDVRAVLPDGGLLLLVPATGVICARITGRSAGCVLRAARLSPLPVADRMLDPVLVRGRIGLVDADDLGAALGVLGQADPDRLEQAMLRPDAAALVHLAVGRVWLDGRSVDPSGYRRAECDPLAVDSDEIVGHLLQEHVAELGLLAHLLDPVLLRAARYIAPVGVDRYGLTFRLAGDHGVTLTRLDFPAALRGPAELPAALRELQRRAAQVMCGCRRVPEPEHRG